MPSCWPGSCILTLIQQVGTCTSGLPPRLSPGCDELGEGEAGKASDDEDDAHEGLRGEEVALDDPVHYDRDWDG